MSVHEKQVALMGFLSDVAEAEGVGEETFVVGGAVRDWLKGQPIKDIDVIIDPTKTAEGRDSKWFADQIASRIDCPVSLTSNRFGVSILTARGKMEVRGENIENETIEIANTRRETYRGKKGKGYKPSDVEVAPLAVDVKRREFTVNTLMWKLGDLQQGPEEAGIIDLTGRGVKDLEDRVLRCPADPEKTFRDDPTRMVRAMKFLLRFDFWLESSTKEAIQQNAEAILKVPQNAISEILIGDVFEVAPGESSLELLEELQLREPIEELIRSEEVFRTTINNWCRRNASVGFWFQIAERMEGVRGPLNFVEQEEVFNKARKSLQGMDPEAARETRRVLKQPGKALQTGRLMKEKGLEGREVGRAMDVARRILAEDPELRKDGKRFTDVVSRIMDNR